MSKYVIRRARQAIPLLVGISFVAFVLLRLAPGGPMAVYAQNPSMSEADMRRIERILGLDQPVHLQYLEWVSGMATGNLGFSYRTGRPVGEIILERVPATLMLMGAAYSAGREDARVYLVNLIATWTGSGSEEGPASICQAPIWARPWVNTA